MNDARARFALAFAPGHVTGLFAPETDARDPRARGSRGAGIVLELGAIAVARFVPGRRRRVDVRDEGGERLPISTVAAQRLSPPAAGTLTVRVSHALPVAQGFGMSAAGATATALAVARLSGSSVRAAVEVAHLADLYGGGGLGGVAAILGGGWESRSRAGVPPFGAVEHRPFRGTLFVGVVGGPIASPRILRSSRILARIREARSEVDAVLAHPTSAEFLDRSERFTDRVGLTTPGLRRTLTALRRCDAWAAQAMFGRSFFAVPRSPAARRRLRAWLRGARLPVLELRSARSGAQALSAQPF
jgi:pantoate kinase